MYSTLALDNAFLNGSENSNALKGYCTISSLFPVILMINRYLWEKQIAENPIKNSNPNCIYRY